MKSSPPLWHRLLFTASFCVILFVGVILVADVATMGLRIMLFGAKLVMIVAILVALLYCFWHLRRWK